MKIKIICVGKLKEQYLKEGIENYLSKLKHYVDIQIVEIKDSNIKQEGKDILSKISNERLIVLAIEGRQVDSIEFSNMIKNINKNVVFIIGGPEGISNEVKEKADFVLSLSKMTFMHEIARLVLLEQIYRAFTIIKGEKYHK